MSSVYMVSWCEASIKCSEFLIDGSGFDVQMQVSDLGIRLQGVGSRFRVSVLGIGSRVLGLEVTL